MTQQQNKLHPHKLAMWIAMGSMTMMFAGFTSAFIVRKGLGNWENIRVPQIFWASTVIILLSSFTIQQSLKYFKNRERKSYRLFLTITMVLGLLFGTSQIIGFFQMHNTNIRLDGNPSGSFLYVIAGMHLLHMAGGIIALFISFINSYRRKTKVYSSTALEVVATYWHFVDVLWVYLFIFFLLNFKS